jgi:hypothetical protein
LATTTVPVEQIGVEEEPRPWAIVQRVVGPAAAALALVADAPPVMAAAVNSAATNSGPARCLFSLTMTPRRDVERSMRAPEQRVSTLCCHATTLATLA